MAEGIKLEQQWPGAGGNGWLSQKSEVQNAQPEPASAIASIAVETETCTDSFPPWATVSIILILVAFFGWLVWLLREKRF